MENNKRLIDANELLDFVKRLKFEGGTKTRTQAGQEVLDIHIPQIVAKIRTVDAVEVVRCKDCMYWDNDFLWCDRKNVRMADNDFCSYGERRAPDERRDEI